MQILDYGDSDKHSSLLRCEIDCGCFVIQTTDFFSFLFSSSNNNFNWRKK
jgi:hypothetical protein